MNVNHIFAVLLEVISREMENVFLNTYAFNVRFRFRKEAVVPYFKFRCLCSLITQEMCLTTII